MTSSTNELHEWLRKPENRFVIAKIIGYLIPLTRFYGNQKMVVCDWHADSRPSAKLYLEDQDGIEKVFCYSCRKTRTSYHYIRDVLKQDPVRVLIDNCSEAEIRTAISQLNDVQGFMKDFKFKDYFDSSKSFVDNIDCFIKNAYNLEGSQSNGNGE